MSEASDRKKRERTEARIGLGSNILGLTAGAAATAAAARNPALRKPTPSNAGPLSRRMARYVKSPSGRGRLIRAGAAGALGLQVANTAGDVVANRVLARESKIGKEDAMPLIEQTFVSKAETAPVTGVGTNIEKRYYDSEADRQRRLGAAAGLLGGTAVVTGSEAARRVKTPLAELKNGDKARILRLKGKPKVVAGLAAVAAASGLGAAGAYKRGISRRNMTWQ